MNSGCIFWGWSTGFDHNLVGQWLAQMVDMQYFNTTAWSRVEVVLIISCSSYASLINLTP